MGVESIDDLFNEIEEMGDGISLLEGASQRDGNVAVNKDHKFFLKQSSVSHGSSNNVLTEVEDSIESNAVASKSLNLHSVESVYASVDGNAPNLRKPIPRLKIAVLAVGTRGDVQPIVAVAKKLKEFGHHVRLATHINFSDFVQSAGVDFYPLGGDPRVLLEYMIRFRGLPLAPGKLSIDMKMHKAIMDSILPACTEPDIKTGAPFRAQAIIANPPALGSLHVAEALNVPLHILYMYPCMPTNEFPSPVAHLPQSPGNRLSYVIVDMLIWWFIRGHINDIRKKELNLPPISYLSTYYGSIYHLPTIYAWSRHVLPKPNDWGPKVDVVGYCFLNLGSNYEPQEELVEWIKKGPKPIYIGFGSMLLSDPRKTAYIILKALKLTGQRGILECGWGDLGVDSELPDDIFLVKNCPHDWLFPQCSAVCPTTIVPFFGDQFFWGDKIHEKGLGPKPIPFRRLTVDALSNAIRFMLEPEVKCRAMKIAQLLENEDGVANAVDSFHRHLPDELPMPPASLVNNNRPNFIHRFFVEIGTICCNVCS